MNIKIQLITLIKLASYKRKNRIKLEVKNRIKLEVIATVKSEGSEVGGVPQLHCDLHSSLSSIHSI